MYTVPGHTELYHQNPFSMTKKEKDMEEKRKTAALGVFAKAGQQTIDAQFKQNNAVTAVTKLYHN